MNAPTTLPDSIRIRPIEPDDRAALTQFYERLSPDSLSDRFHGARRGIADTTADGFCAADHVRREGIVAVLAPDETGSSRIVGHLCLEASGPDELEMAIAVADDLQRHGIGRASLAAAIWWAQTQGMGHLRASMRWGNGAIISLVRAAGHPVAWTAPPGGGLEATIDLGTDAVSAA